MTVPSWSKRVKSWPSYAIFLARPAAAAFPHGAITIGTIVTVMTWCDYDSMTLKANLLKRLLVSFWIVVLFAPELF